MNSFVVYEYNSLKTTSFIIIIIITIITLYLNTYYIFYFIFKLGI